MARLQVRLISRGMKAVLHSSGVEREMKRRADRVAGQARSSAPVATGAYRASIRAYTEDHPTRVVGRVAAEVPYAANVEASRRVLGMAIDAARG